MIEQSINYLGLHDIQNKYLDELSGGQRQLTYIAMVIAQDTDYIFLDEPLNNLDIKTLFANHEKHTTFNKRYGQSRSACHPRYKLCCLLFR